MTKEQIDLLINSIGSEVIDYLNIPTKPKDTWSSALDDESFEIWKILIEGEDYE